MFLFHVKVKLEKAVLVVENALIGNWVNNEVVGATLNEVFSSLLFMVN